MLIEYLYGSKNSKTEIKLNQVISFLRSYSLLKVTNETIAIHHLVQDCIRTGMTLTAQKVNIKKAIGTIKKVYPLENKNAKDYQTVKILLPHMENFFSYAKKYLSNADVIELAKYLSDAYWKFANYHSAKVLLEEALAFQEKYFGLKHPEVANTLIDLAQLEYNINNKNNALKLIKSANNILKNYPEIYSEYYYIKKAYDLKQKLLE